MSRTGSSGLVIALAASRLAFADPLAIETTGALPFTTSELETALALRTRLAAPDAPRRIAARVSATNGTTLQIELGGRSRRIALEGQHGADAARLVAFAILDLAGDQLDPPAAPADAVTDARPLEPPHEPTVDAPLGQTASTAPDQFPTTAPSWSIALWGTSGTRSDAAIELGRRLHGPVRAIASAGAGLAQTTLAVERRAFPARLGLAWRRGAFEARATAIAIVEQASAERPATNVVAGGGASIVWLPVQRGSWALLAGAGADGFASAIDYQLHGMNVVATERAAWWLGVGVAWESP